jgi:ABC-type bacteriocin/lantibiotic exporter with double-glycine peptidase domain
MSMDCGAIAVWIVASVFGVPVELSDIRLRKKPHPELGLSIADLIWLFESVGLQAHAIHVNYPECFSIHLPCIAHMHSRHFVVLLACEKDQALIYDVPGQLRYVRSDWMFARFTFNFVEIEQCKPALDPATWPAFLRTLPR